MGIIVKFTLRSIKEKKFRTFLILLSITLSVALTFASIALKDSITDTFTEMIKKYMGTANVLITANEESPSQTIRLKPLGDAQTFIDYQIGTVDAQAEYKRPGETKAQKISIRGYEQADLDLLGVVNLITTLDEPYVGKVMYVSEQAASANGWTLGQSIDVTVQGQKHKVRIAGIGANQGALSYQDGASFAVMPTSALQKMFNIEGRYTFVLAKTAEGVPISEGIEALKGVYKRYEVSEPVPWDEIITMLNSIVIPFMFMLLLVIATAVFIIYTAFKVITTEKLPILGTFRSIGATKATTDFVLIMESVFYGIIGSAFGLALGTVVLNLLGGMMAKGMMGGEVAAQTSASVHYYVIAGSFGLVLSVLSGLVPIIKVSKISVRDIVLGTIQQVKSRKITTLISGICIIFASLAIPLFMKGPMALPLNGIATLLLCIGLVFIIPFAADLLVTLIAKPVQKIFGNLGYIAVMNIRGNDSIINNISLLSLGIAGILLINTISFSITTEVLKVYNDVKYDVDLSLNNANRQTLGRVLAIKGVDEVYGVYQASAEVENTGVKLGFVQGVDGMDFFDYWHMDFMTPTDLSQKYLGQSRVIIINQTIKNKLNVDVGDVIPLTFSKDITRDYVVVGVINTLMNNGNYAITSGKTLKQDAGLSGYSSILIKTSAPNEVKAAIEDKYKREWYWVQTLDEMEAQNNAANAAIIGALKSFSIIAMMIGIFGILNNFVVSLMARSRSMAVMKSVGLSKKQTVSMLSLEALISGLIGGMMGVLGSLAMIVQIGVILHLIDLPIKLSIDSGIMLTGFIAGGLISVVSNWLPAIRTSKQSIVAAIKFE
ncbi:MULTISPECIES: ABC transporter permease [unclassified Fusibacter]|uniref:ABC transporter permease n=1 Tax=unclassified Fusibacter TaxID=2624464 RepID=UPI0010134C19|nr:MULTISPECIES: ABC transporter permease [unclassified Fusibacter]MCK8060299.1 ABC transporter permease [Fusibacter sp. A2]NPE20412.1 ABC transporter permease [Fusibacter sp. A1]RXV63617.1 hypothetical protein DWB64_01175 [Fusibacter sp. A1]